MIFVFAIVSYTPVYFYSVSHSQETSKFQVSLLKVRDFSESNAQGLDTKVLNTLRIQLQQSSYFAMKNPELVETWLSKSKITTTDEETAQQMAKGIGLDGVFLADILKVTMDKKAKEVQLEMQLQLIDKNGDVISRALITAGSGNKPGFTGDAELLLQEAIHNITLAAVQETQKNLTTQGTVTYIKGNGIVAVTLNDANGIKNGAEFIITRNGEKIARCVVIEVHKTNSFAQVHELVKGKFISPSDDVHLIYNPFPDPKTESLAKKSNASKSSIKTLATIVALGGVVALLVSGKKSESASSVGVALSVSASPGNIIADKKTTSTITASLKDAQTNVAVADGQTVTFKASAGTLLQGSATTLAGVATVQLQSADKPGTSVITAAYANASTSTAVLFTSLSLTLSSSVASIAANGTSAATLTATVKDASNAPAPDGTLVTFSATDGTIAGSGTTKNGAATTTLTSKASPAKITATVTAKSGGAEATTAIDFVPVQPKIIFLSANPASVPADGKTAATLTAIVKDDTNNPVVEGTEVKFTTNLGTVTATGKTVSGQAQSTITGTSPGAATVIAQADSVSTSTTVTFTSLAISAAASPTSIPADGASTTSLTITVKNAASGAALQNTAVTLKTSNGTFTSNGTATVTKNTDANGNITETLRADTKAGNALLTITCGDTTATSTVNFTPMGVSTMTVDATPSSIPADGKSTATLSVAVKDIYGNFVQDGTEVKVVISDAGAKLFATDGKIKTTNGIATTTITSSTFANKPLLRACYPSSVACTGADLGDIHAETYITFTSGTPAFLTLAADSLNIKGMAAPGVSIDGVTDVLAVLAYDANHIVVSDGTVVSFTTNCGVIVATTKTGEGLNVGGYNVQRIAKTGTAYALYVTSAAASCPVSSCGIGRVVTSAKSGDVGAIQCIVVSGDIANIALTTDKATIKADGSNSATLTATATDFNGNPVTSGLTLDFSTTLGVINPNTALTSGTDLTKLSQATSTLRGNGAPGTATVTVKWRDNPTVSSTININIQ